MRTVSTIFAVQGEISVKKSVEIAHRRTAHTRGCTRVCANGCNALPDTGREMIMTICRSNSGGVQNEKITRGNSGADMSKCILESDAPIVAPLVFAYVPGW